MTCPQFNLSWYAKRNANPWGVMPNAEVESAPTWRRERGRREIGKLLPQREKVRLGSDLERWVRAGAKITPHWDGAFGQT